jgi:hypothetical protein
VKDGSKPRGWPKGKPRVDLSELAVTLNLHKVLIDNISLSIDYLTKNRAKFPEEYQTHPKTISEYFIKGIQLYLKSKESDIIIIANYKKFPDLDGQIVESPIIPGTYERIHVIHSGESVDVTINVPVYLHQKLLKILAKNQISKIGPATLGEIYEDCAVLCRLQSWRETHERNRQRNLKEYENQQNGDPEFKKQEQELKKSLDMHSKQLASFTEEERKRYFKRTFKDKKKKDL